jgi:hypothetical protein
VLDVLMAGELLASPSDVSGLHVDSFGARIKAIT